MILFLNFLLLIFLSLIFLFLVLISLPYFFQLNIEYKEQFHYEIVVNNFFSKIKHSNNHTGKNENYIKLFNYQHNIANKDKKKIENKTQNKNDNNQGNKIIEKKRKFRLYIKLFNRRNINHLLCFLLKIYQLIKPDDFCLNIFLSFDDPYYNGLLMAFYHSLKGCFPDFPLRITVNWQEEVIEGKVKAAGKIIPVVIIYHLLFFLFSTQTLKIIWQLYKSKK